MHDPFEKNNSHSPSQFLRFHLRSVTKMEPVRDRMIDREQKKIRRPLTLEDGKRMMLKTLGELDPEDEADPKNMVSGRTHIGLRVDDARFLISRG
uniref:uncharacterized protein LOC122605579 isoform X2 n=1 Tax=Erigeron canadensis TaxID=72917 RepID=UPI001CB965C7|nr:uncharacterized protein LOC122605579 isoform X2 [Erigeron canadensis]XP_043634476.1 uncharacterized protein LOC122605579 isoform X2 [Erigeron canadensis]XP_043634477.1 uncharacterized protein LOC122605579 isoform X2 [Erigeron canadensis]